MSYAPQARADVPPADPHSIVTIQLENDAASIPGTDELYTSGERLGYVGPTGAVPGFLSNLGQGVFGQGSQRLEIDLQQVIFTPTNTQLYNPNPHDRPYAGQLSAKLTLIQDTTTTRSMLGRRSASSARPRWRRPCRTASTASSAIPPIKAGITSCMTSRRWIFPPGGSGGWIWRIMVASACRCCPSLPRRSAIPRSMPRPAASCVSARGWIRISARR
ncbi:lipid A deacylase LpxR family protein [Acidocella sp. MX-AZ03]|nr:lipid A-modifier LpxR family protein [Acidocella sp. MX-AZ03]WBO59777.1 lipid A deacylase LpxR family protein [Acidocella sp. MX-AZ03]